VNVAVVLSGQCKSLQMLGLLLAFSHWAAKFQGWAWLSISMFFPLRLLVKMVLSLDLQSIKGTFVFAPGYVS